MKSEINKVTRICPECGESFTPRSKLQKFCYSNCSMAGRKRKLKKVRVVVWGVCVACGKRYKKLAHNQGYCSKECNKERRNSLGLTKPLIREYFLEKANFLCEECGKENDSNLQLHHVEYLYKGGKNSEDNIIVLCKECHLKKHHIRPT